MFYLGDCIEGMQKLDDKSVDAIVTSPPYNLNIKYSKYNDTKPLDQYLSWLGDVFTAVSYTHLTLPTIPLV